MPAPPPEHDTFDEAGYFRLYPEIAQAVTAGAEASGWAHYHSQGRSEGRRPNDVESIFYLRAYPQAVADIEAGRASDAASHYVAFGRARGYRPNRTVPRQNQVAMPATFPFLWTDLPHALDLIEGRLELGQIAERQAALLRQWVRDGYACLAAPIDPPIVAAAALDLERVFAGACPDVLFSCSAVGLGPVHWQPEINPYPAAALDIHYVSRAVRTLLFAEPLAELLGLLLEAPALLTHSRGMLRDAPQAPRRDCDRSGFTLSRQFVTAWFVLEDAAGEADAMRCAPGSHRSGASGYSGAAGEGLQPVAAKRGAVLVRHPELVHCASPAPEDGTRRGILARYCPRYVAPLYSEKAEARLHMEGKDWFTTGYYGSIDPLD